MLEEETQAADHALPHQKQFEETQIMVPITCLAAPKGKNSRYTVNCVPTCAPITSRVTAEKCQRLHTLHTSAL